MCVHVHIKEIRVLRCLSCPFARILVICNYFSSSLFSFVFAAPSMEPRAWCVWTLFRFTPMKMMMKMILLHPDVKVLFIFNAFSFKLDTFYSNRYILPKPCKCRYILPCHLCQVHSAGAILSQMLQGRGICGTRALASRDAWTSLTYMKHEEAVWIRLLLVRQCEGLMELRD